MLLGVDVGTGSTKGVLATQDGEVVAEHVVAHGIEVPRPGWVEQDAEQVWWGDVVEVCRALTSGRYRGADVAAVAVSAIGPCLVPIDARGRPLRKAILYGVDVRAACEIDALEREFGATSIFDLSGMRLTSQAIGPKLRWLHDHEPGVWRDAHSFQTATSFLVRRLTDEAVIDRHTASHFAPLFDLRAGTWTDRFAERVAMPARLPRLAWSDEVAGTLTRAAAAATGLVAGTPVAVGTVDAVAEAVSVGVVRPGDLMLMYGSTAFLVLVTERPHPDPRVWTTRGAFAGQYVSAGGMATTGSLTTWFKDVLLGGGDAADAPGFQRLFAEAAAVPAGSGGLLALPYFSGERTPLHDPNARGVIAGLSLAHGRGHVFRALLEAVAYGVRHNLETFRTLGAPIERIVAVGGGTRGDLWTQIVSDVADVVQERTSPRHGAAFGDAYLAGRAAGLLPAEALSTWVRNERSIVPDPEVGRVYDVGYLRYRKLYEATADLVHALAGADGASSSA